MVVSFASWLYFPAHFQTPRYLLTAFTFSPFTASASPPLSLWCLFIFLLYSEFFLGLLLLQQPLMFFCFVFVFAFLQHFLFLFKRRFLLFLPLLCQSPDCLYWAHSYPYFFRFSFLGAALYFLQLKSRSIPTKLSAWMPITNVLKHHI